MQIDLHEKSQNLLETLANSIHDREPKSQNPFFFNIAEIQAAEKWLQEFIKEIKHDCICV
jgi:hypothetical protein